MEALAGINVPTLTKNIEHENKHKRRNIKQTQQAAALLNT